MVVQEALYISVLPPLSNFLPSTDALLPEVVEETEPERTSVLQAARTLSPEPQHTWVISNLFKVVFLPVTLCLYLGMTDRG